MMISALRSLAYWLAVGLGSGLVPRAPGTAGTLLAVPLAWALMQLPATWHAALALAAVVLGIPICAEGSRRLGRHDPGAVVWDEIAAFLLLALAIPTGLLWLGVAFVLFRIFDIVKPWPIRDVDHRLHGGAGIMLDDLLAAGYAAVCLALLSRLFDAV
jgi:phosphatidylglycerophosphatase A